MFLQTTILWKGFLTYITWKEFHTWVCSQMFVKVPPSEKSFGHRMQGYGFSPECILICPFKSPPCEKAVGHWLQEYAFFTWICSDVLLQITSVRKVFLTLIARMRFFFWMCLQCVYKPFHQRCLQAFDCKDVVSYLSVSSYVLLNHLLVRKLLDIDCKSMLFSPEFVRMCFFKSLLSEKSFYHWLQEWGFSS